MASEQALLTEYEIAHNEVGRLNTQLWTTAQILIPLSLAGIGILSNFSTHTIQTLTTISISGIVSSLILWGWYTIARRWLVYQDIAQYRIIEIEKKLGLWCTRYELYAAKRSRGVDLLKSPESFSKDEKLHYKNISKQMFPKGRPTPVVIRNLVLLMILTWILLIIRETALFAGIM